MRTGRLAAARTIDDYSRQYPGTGDLAREAGLQTLLSCPISTGQRIFGALVLTWAEPQPLYGCQLMFVDGIASHWPRRH